MPWDLLCDNGLGKFNKNKFIFHILFIYLRSNIYIYI